MNHELKTWPPYYQAIIDGKKRCEIRKNDRCFSVGDVLRLREYDPIKEYDPITEKYTGRYCYVRVDYVLSDFLALEEDYVAMSITLIN